MGNSSSLEQQQDFDSLPADLFDLEDAHFRCLWKFYPLTAPQVTQAARSIPRNSLSGLYHQEEESEEAELAVRLCELLPELAALRFKLVPGRLEESKFWQAVLILLQEKVIDYNAHRQYDNTDEEDEFVSEDESEQSVPNNASPMNGHAPKPVTTNENGFGNDLAAELEEKNSQIRKLQKQVKELKAALSNADNTTTPKTPKHKGSWKRDKDSQDFWSTPKRSRTV